MNMTNRQVAEAFANGNTVRNKNMFIEDGVLYSYGYHFPIAKRILGRNGRTVYLFNTDTYSSTTSRHQSYTRQALTGETIIECPDADEDQIMEYIEGRQAELMDKADRARLESNRQMYKAEVEEYRSMLSDAVHAGLIKCYECGGDTDYRMVDTDGLNLDEQLKCLECGLEVK